MAKLIIVTNPIGDPIEINPEFVTAVRAVSPAEGAHKYARTAITIGGEKYFVRETVGEVVARIEAVKK